MSADKPVSVQLVELLGASEAILNDQPVIVLTIHYDLPRFVPHNIALTKPQTWRLATNLQNVLVPFVLLLIATVAGCSARVEVESATRSSPLPASEVTQAATDERARTAVEVNVLQNQSPEPVAPEAPQPSPAKVVASEAKPVTISSNTIIVNYRAGDVTNHVETHIHVHEPPAPRVEERIVVHRDFEAEPPGRVDERCERLAREHEQRVEMWKRFPFGR